MPLTPQDVHAKLFTSVRFAKGYDEDEVDAFLDEIEAELTRLLADNEDLRRQLVAARAAAPEDTSGPRETEDILRRTLLLAQRTADEAVAEARAEASRIVAGAREQASAVEKEIASRQQAMALELESQRRALESQVEQLRTFEREYRSRLRAYLETQLRDLE
ncbi:MAG: DivIVA domain-containing protein, partial [Mycobacteriales bacterium]